MGFALYITSDALERKAPNAMLIMKEEKKYSNHNNNPKIL